MSDDKSFRTLPDTVSAQEATGLMPAAPHNEAEQQRLSALQGAHEPVRPPKRSRRRSKR